MDTLIVQTIQNPDGLSHVSTFRISHLLWGTAQIPETYGYLAFLPDKGFCLHMVCMESNPVRTYTQDQDPVYRDSAMEAFFRFYPAGKSRAELPYINLEFNANGALLAAYGSSRFGRTAFSPDSVSQFQCRACVYPDRWTADLFLPFSVLEQVYGPLALGHGSTFSCNFYKISEGEGREHFASFSPVLTSEPDFHRPEFFAQAQIE